MKLSALIERVLGESEAAEQAKNLGLEYGGYGRWKDPKTGKVVAKTIDGKLVKTDENPTAAPQAQAPGQAPAPDSQTSEPIAQSPGTGYAQDGQAPVDTGAVPDAGDAPDASPDAEPVEMDTGISRLLGAAGGDKMKLRKALVKRFRGGEIGAKKWLDKLDAMEAAEKNDVRAQIASFDKSRADALAAKKAKYAAKYPSPQI